MNKLPNTVDNIKEIYCKRRILDVLRIHTSNNSGRMTRIKKAVTDHYWGSLKKNRCRGMRHVTDTPPMTNKYNELVPLCTTLQCDVMTSSV